MKVFISSLIGGFEAYRAAAKSAITTLRHEPLMAEDFGALPTSPQIACLDGVRQSDLVLLILGESYGTVQPSSGISATHEEFIEAKDRKQVLAFVQEGVTRDSRQAAFVQEVQAWSTGLFRAAFRNADELRDRVTTALHDYDMKNVTGPVDPIETLARATQLVSTEERGVYRSGSTLILSAAGAPLQPVLRPTQIEDERLHAQILQEALFGKRAIFSTSEGNENKISGHTLAISQGHGKAALALNEQADIVLTLPFERERRGMTFPAVIEEDVKSGLLKAIGFTSDILEMIDPKERLSHVALVAAIRGQNMYGWRTRAEQNASPDGGTVSISDRENKPVHLTPPVRQRAALRVDAARLADDLLVLLRRQFKASRS
jgi:Domain of unknown function (DUF4062)